ncbi:MAG: hypothetical protein E7589_00240 [Ruminococcaceae bacterium]|nr:hypothetical protein [Oscillospiraceae bacterium]
MKMEKWNEGLNYIDADLVDEFIIKSERIEKGRRKRAIWIRFGAVAACFFVVVAAVIAAPMLYKNPPVVGGTDTTDNADATTNNVSVVTDTEGTEGETVNDTPNISDVIIQSQELHGDSLEYIVGNRLDMDDLLVMSPTFESEPPACTFENNPFAVKATVVENYPDVYYKMVVSSTFKPQAYKLILMETVEVLSGENIPKYFLYLIPEYLFVDMSVYDSLLISMAQIGAENYVLRNGTKNQVEAFSLPIFADSEDLPQLGKIIAFSGDIFDESLWQTKSWIYGYQFAKLILENPGDHWLDDIIVQRGMTEDEAIAKIKDTFGSYTNRVITLNSWGDEAKAALEYVKPFENGVFSQTFFNNSIIFRRFINGCQTEETVTIEFGGTVTYSDVRYTAEEIAAVTDISVDISERSEEYANNIPVPSHTDPDGKELISLNVFGWYVKTGEKIYGIIKTAWIYEDVDDMYIVYYDDTYTLYDMSESTERSISRDDLKELVGGRNIYHGEYGVGIEVPMC